MRGVRDKGEYEKSASTAFTRFKMANATGTDLMGMQRCPEPRFVLLPAILAGEKKQETGGRAKREQSPAQMAACVRSPAQADIRVAFGGQRLDHGCLIDEVVVAATQNKKGI